MANRINISDLFNANGCLKQSTLIRTIDKKLDEEQMLYVSKHLDECPLCKEALEGIAEKGTDRYTKGMDELRSRFHSTYHNKNKKSRSLLISAITAAASVIIVAGILYYYHQARLMKVNTVAETSQNPEVIAGTTGKAEMRAPRNETANPAPVKKERKTTAKSKSVSIRSDMPFEAVQQADDLSGADTMMAGQKISTERNYNTEPSAEEVTVISSDEYAAAVKAPVRSAPESTKKAGYAEKSRIMKADFSENDKSEIRMKNVLQQTDKMPVFEGGGINKFIDYMQDKIRDSIKFSEGNINKSLIISFVVDTIGRPVDISMLNSNDQKLNNEIIQLFQGSPDWLPGMEKGIKTSVKYTINLQTRK